MAIGGLHRQREIAEASSAAQSFAEVTLLYEQTEDVFEGEVGFLNFCGDGGGDDDGEVGEVFDLAAVVAGEGEGGKFLIPGLLDGFEAVGGVAGAGDDEEDISFVSKGFDLAGEDAVEAVVVGYGGEDGGVGGEGYRTHCRAVSDEAADEFGDQVLSVGGGASISADQQFSSCFQGGGGEVGGLHHGFVDGFVMENCGEGVDGLLELLMDDLGEGLRHADYPLKSAALPAEKQVLRFAQDDNFLHEG
jgi:hypothetical protein